MKYYFISYVGKSKNGPTSDAYVNTVKKGRIDEVIKKLVDVEDEYYHQYVILFYSEITESEYINLYRIYN